MKTSVKELAESAGVDYAVAGGLVKFLESRGIAKLVEQRKREDGRGKPTNIYEVPETVTVELKEAS
jgi:hypothetical protein